jgi:hypothetical protein
LRTTRFSLFFAPIDRGGEKDCTESAYPVNSPANDDLCIGNLPDMAIWLIDRLCKSWHPGYIAAAMVEDTW